MPLKERVLLLKAINDTGIIGKLYFECLKKVYPIWSKDFPNNPVMTALIARAESFLYHQSGIESNLKHSIMIIPTILNQSREIRD